MSMKMEGKTHIQRLGEQEEGMKEEASVSHWIKPVGGNAISETGKMERKRLGWGWGRRLRIQPWLC